MYHYKKPGSVALSVASVCRSRGCKLDSKLGYIMFVKIDHEIIAMVIPPPPLSLM